MTPERLRELLRQADAAHPPPALAPARLMRAVNRRAAGRRQRRWVFQAAAGLLVALTGSTLFHQPLRAARVAPPPDAMAHETGATGPQVAPDAGPSLAALNDQADSQAAIAARVAALLTKPVTAEQTVVPPAPPDPLVAIAAQRELAARTLVEYADRMQHELAVPAAAVAPYRDAAELFPDTTWARVANVRLTSLTKKQGV